MRKIMLLVGYIALLFSPFLFAQGAFGEYLGEFCWSGRDHTGDEIRLKCGFDHMGGGHLVASCTVTEVSAGIQMPSHGSAELIEGKLKMVGTVSVHNDSMIFSQITSCSFEIPSLKGDCYSVGSQGPIGSVLEVKSQPKTTFSLVPCD